MNAILLVFFTLHINNPSTYSGPQISDRLFESHEECAWFVNQVAKESVVDANFEFEFASIDGWLYKGGCYTENEYKKLLEKYNIKL
jgi:hypothetical protein